MIFPFLTVTKSLVENKFVEVKMNFRHYVNKRVYREKLCSASNLLNYDRKKHFFQKLFELKQIRILEKIYKKSDNKSLLVIKIL